MAATIKILSAARALLVLGALLAAGARADEVTFQKCKDLHVESQARLRWPGQDDGASTLTAQNCQLNEISSDDLSGLPNVAFVYFNENNIRKVDPAVFRNTPEISYLFLDDNGLTEVPVFGEADVLKKCNSLVIRNNKITRLENPKTFSSMKELRKLNLQVNLIEYINPDVLKGLDHLDWVNFGSNKLTYLPDKFFAVPSVDLVDLSNNLIEYVSPGAFSGTHLGYLYLNGNKLTHLPERIVSSLTSTGGKLRYFLFYDNALQCGCLSELLAEVKQLDDCEYADSYLSNQKKECEQAQETQCKRLSETEYISHRKNATVVGSVGR